MAKQRSDFDSVGDFHEKFQLPNVTHRISAPKPISPELRDFRIKFLLEELEELCEGYGLVLEWKLRDGDKYLDGFVPGPQDLPKIADALVDLVYVALGSAHLHGFPWAELFAEVQRANMTKERCELDHKFEDSGHPVDLDSCDHEGCGQPRGKHSLRGSVNDVIKPKGWTAPRIAETLLNARWPGPRLPMPDVENL